MDLEYRYPSTQNNSMKNYINGQEVNYQYDGVAAVGASRDHRVGMGSELGLGRIQKQAQATVTKERRPCTRS